MRPIALPVSQLALAVLVALACASPGAHDAPASPDLVAYASVVHPVSGTELPRIRLPDRPRVEASVNRTLDAEAAELRCDPEFAGPADDLEWSTAHEVTYAANDVFSVRISSNGFCGGAHPIIDADSSLTFDLRTGEAVDFRSLFASYDRDAKAIVGAYLRHLTAEEREDCEDVLTESELADHYFSYTIGPSGVRMRTAFPHVLKVCNRTSVVPFDALRPYAKPGSLLERLADLPLPADVVAEVDRRIAECDLDGDPPMRPLTPADRRASLEAVRAYDLTGDGHPDYLIDDSLVFCSAGASFRHGNGGTGIIVMVSGADGVRVAADSLAFGARVVEAPGSPRLWLTLGGRYCGQDTEGVSRAEMIGCERPLDWNAETGAFALADMRETRFELPQ